MRGFVAVFRKEMGHYFVSPIAYIVATVFLVLAGFFFNVILSNVLLQSQQMSMQSMRFGGAADFDVPGTVLRYFLGLLGTVSLFLVPMLTIGVYAEEKSRGTMELLMTSPLRDAGIVLGKFAASLTLYLLLLVPTLLYVGTMFWKSDPRPPWRLLLAGYLGLMLLGAVLLAIGSFLSSLTESQVIAGVSTFGVSLLLWVMDAAASGSSSNWSAVLQYLSIVQHFQDFTRGIIDVSHIVFFLSAAAFGVFLTLRSIDSLRWRRA
jgi:ABC-2 type transport system permease protein